MDYRGRGGVLSFGSWAHGGTSICTVTASGRRSHGAPTPGEGAAAVGLGVPTILYKPPPPPVPPLPLRHTPSPHPPPHTHTSPTLPCPHTCSMMRRIADQKTSSSCEGAAESASSDLAARAACSSMPRRAHWSCSHSLWRGIQGRGRQANGCQAVVNGSLEANWRPAWWEGKVTGGAGGGGEGPPVRLPSRPVAGPKGRKGGGGEPLGRDRGRRAPGAGQEGPG